jgi:hypothetical protein
VAASNHSRGDIKSLVATSFVYRGDDEGEARDFRPANPASTLMAGFYA